MRRQAPPRCCSRPCRSGSSCPGKQCSRGTRDGPSMPAERSTELDARLERAGRGRRGRRGGGRTRDLCSWRDGACCSERGSNGGLTAEQLAALASDDMRGLQRPSPGFCTKSCAGGLERERERGASESRCERQGAVELGPTPTRSGRAAGWWVVQRRAGCMGSAASAQASRCMMHSTTQKLRVPVRAAGQKGGVASFTNAHRCCSAHAGRRAGPDPQPRSSTAACHASRGPY